MRRSIHWSVGAVLAALLVLSVCVASGSGAGATSNGEWSVQPYFNGQTIPRDWFEYTLKPGQVIRDIVSISNLTDNAKVFAVYPRDAYDTPADGGFALLQRKDKNSDAGKWIHIGVVRLTIPARRQAALPFEIAVPSNASPGDHAAGILVEDIGPNSLLKSGKGVTIQRRIGARVYVRVAGPINPAVEVTRIVFKPHKEGLVPGTHGSADIGYVLKNVGNVRITPTAQLTVKGLFGRTLDRFPIHQLPELLPGGTVVVTEHWKSMPWIDRASLQVHVMALNGQYNITRTKTVWIGPWLWIDLTLLALAIVLALWLWRRRRRQRGTGEPGTPAPEPEPEPAAV